MTVVNVFRFSLGSSIDIDPVAGSLKYEAVPFPFAREINPIGR